MKVFGPWETTNELGSGGQGKVYRARNTRGVSAEHYSALRTFFDSMKYPANRELPEKARRVAEATEKYISRKGDYVALKELHESKDKESYDKAVERMKNELEAMKGVTHPNLIKVLDANIEERWLVLPLFINGTLSDNLNQFKGNIGKSLVAFRKLVEAVAALHTHGVIHRDIKPDNIFFADDGELILGDLGLVYFTDKNFTSVTSEYEKVGTTDWMPIWEHVGMDVDKLPQTFDLYGLGKILWAMISGRKILPREYQHQNDFEVERMFPSDYGVYFIREILDCTIVESEKDCISSTEDLLILVNEIIEKVESRAYKISLKNEIRFKCRMCGEGYYFNPKIETQIKVTEDKQRGTYGYGLKHSPLFCNKCGHVELFADIDDLNRRFN